MRSRKALGLLFYGALVVVLVMILFKLLPAVLPDLVAGRISRNSEGILLVLILAAWIQGVRPRLRGTAREWPVTLAVGAASLAVGLLLFFTDPINQVKTLNETFLAAALLVPYVQLARPLPRWVPYAAAVVILVVVLVGNENATITLMAEALGALMMTTIALDVVDRGILDPLARTSVALRVAWYAFLLAGPVIFWQTDNGAGVDGGLGTFLVYAGRTTEVFLCLLALQLYLAVGLGRTGISSGSESDPRGTPAPTRESRVGADGGR